MDDKRDVEHKVKRPAIDNWTKNDPSDPILKSKKAKKRLIEKEDHSKLADSARPGTGRPDAEEMYRGRLQRTK